MNLAYWRERFEREGRLAVGFCGRKRAKGLAKRQEQLEGLLQGHLKALLPRGVKRLIDYGCGWGRFSKFLARFTTEYIGVDLLSEHVELARTALPQFRFMTIGEAQENIGWATAVVTLNVIQHLVNSGERQEVFSLLRGWAPQLCVFHELSYLPPAQEKAPHVCVVTLETLEEMMPDMTWTIKDEYPGEDRKQREAVFVGVRRLA